MAKKNYDSGIVADIANFEPEKQKTSPATVETVKAQTGAKIDEIKAPTKTLVEDATPKTSEASIPGNFYCRRTLFLTYEQAIALDTIAFDRVINKSDVARMIFEKGLEAIEPGITKRVEDKASIIKKRDFDGMTETQREKYMKSAEKG